MSNPPVVVTFAVPEESRDFRRVAHRLRGTEMRIEHIGVGPHAAAESMRRLLAAGRPRLIVCTGFAGGLDPRLVIGDLVVADNLSTPELFAEIRQRTWLTRPPAFGAVVSRMTPVESVEAKAVLARETCALAVDMESEAVAEACRAAGVPLLVVRTISDPASAPLPVPFDEWFDIRGQRPRVLRLMKYLACHPSRVAPFARFVRGLTPARRSLAEFLLEFLADFPVTQ